MKHALLRKLWCRIVYWKHDPVTLAPVTHIRTPEGVKFSAPGYSRCRRCGVKLP